MDSFFFGQFRTVWVSFDLVETEQQLLLNFSRLSTKKMYNRKLTRGVNRVLLQHDRISVIFWFCLIFFRCKARTKIRIVCPSFFSWTRWISKLKTNGMSMECTCTCGWSLRVVQIRRVNVWERDGDIAWPYNFIVMLPSS